MNRRDFLRVGAAGLGAAVAGTARSQSEERNAMLPFPLVDTHVHFWDLDHLDYGWVRGSEVLRRSFFPKDHVAAAAPYEVDALVFVQAACAPHQDPDEVDWVTELAKEDPRIRGIVGSAPLEDGEGVVPLLERYARNPLVKGIRRLLQGEKESDAALRPGYVEGVRALAPLGLSCDLGVRRDQLAACAELARRCPDVKFMLNHIGVPDIKGGEQEPWREHIRELAELPHVWCKVSGVATAAGEDWTAEQVRPYVDHVLECFGFDRVTFGSDWPVMLLATDYPRWVDTLAAQVADCTDDEKRRLFRDNGIAFYRLEV